MSPVPPTPPITRSTRAALLAGVCLLVALVYLFADVIGPRGRAAVGIACFILIVAALSSNLRAVSWRTVGWGLALQFSLALFILKLEVGGVRPGYVLFGVVARAVARFLEFTNAGSRFVFGGLADPDILSKVLPDGFVFAFTALPTIIFASSFFAMLYHLGILQVVVRAMAWVMTGFMGTSGAETLSAAANVFLGQTEAPIIVRPYVPAMTQSELLSLMVGGLATISGGIMAVYIALGADPIAILTTSVMAAPCGLYLSKLMLPETERPATRGEVTVGPERTHVNLIDAISAGASDGLALALNVAAMLIVFLAFIALCDFLLGWLSPRLTLAGVFAWLFAPVALLVGVPSGDVPAVADLLGTKLVANEFVAFVKLTTTYEGVISERGHVLSTFALTGFANFGSIGILLGGIGGMAPARRPDVARLGLRALLVGSLVTMINASIAALLM